MVGLCRSKQSALMRSSGKRVRTRMTTRRATRLDNGPMTEPRYPRYRVLTGPDDDRFCERVSEALDLGYELHGGPALTSHNGNAYVAQSLLWTATTPPPFRPDAESQ